MKKRFLGLPVPVIVIATAVVLLVGGGIAVAAYFFTDGPTGTVTIVPENDLFSVSPTTFELGSRYPGESTGSNVFTLTNTLGEGSNIKFSYEIYVIDPVTLIPVCRFPGIADGAPAENHVGTMGGLPLTGYVLADAATVDISAVFIVMENILDNYAYGDSPDLQWSITAEITMDPPTEP